MITMTSEYLGELRTRTEHLQSGSILITDAPTDNQGKGEAFSPTDTLCTALCTCMMTLMGIAANREGIDLKGLKAEIEKIMASNPRKVSKVRITFTHPGLVGTAEQEKILTEAARTCPVALSVSADLIQDVTFNFNRIQP
ncbi:OsmC family protein [Fulvivirga sedimenti]|uniref:OsmC family protein n=1 Tax=Fulvivirga sedimenti TaxID=2879465 RepID=A0A9X1HXU3_9BACT|nr:OsmC family protein [Fulvivirga sedimenti]MCA6079013.1 OsmC family protein [Fulvivirga sedimenti]